MMAFCPEHPKWDQNPKFTPLSETTSIPTPFMCGVPPPPPRKQSKNIFKHFFCFSFISETRRKSSRTASSKEHECATVILFQTNMPKQRVINQPNRTQRSCNERGRSQNNGQVTDALFFSSPRLTLRAKCRVRLAWLGKRVLCRLISRLSTSEHSNLHFGPSTGILTNRKQIYASFWKHFL